MIKRNTSQVDVSFHFCKYGMSYTI